MSNTQLMIQPLQLKKAVALYFNQEEQLAVARAFDIDIQTLRSQHGRTQTATQIVDQVQQQNKLELLAEYLIKKRPNQLTRNILNESPAIDIQPPSAPAPFKGTDYYDFDDHGRFYGRDMLIAQLTKRVEQNRFLSIIGAAGSGKTSLVRAGLIPTLSGQKSALNQALGAQSGRQWQYHIFTPSAHPLRALASTLAASVDQIPKLEELYTNRANGLDTHLKLIQKRDGVEKIVLVVDQFEELYTLCLNPEVRRTFIDNLLIAAHSKQAGPGIIVPVLQAEYYGAIAEHGSLRQAVANRQIFIGNMKAAELRHAIRKPAAQLGLQIEPGLTDLIIDDMPHTPQALSQLSQALLETWHRRDDNVLTAASYVSIGGVQGQPTKLQSKPSPSTEAKPLTAVEEESTKAVPKINGQNGHSGSAPAQPRRLEPIQQSKTPTPVRPAPAPARASVAAPPQVTSAQAETASAPNKSNSQGESNSSRSRIIIGSLIAVVIGLLAAVGYLASNSIREARDRPLAQNPMVTIAAGQAINPDPERYSLTPETVEVPRFQIDRFEVSNRQYKLCVANGPCTEPLDTIRYDNPEFEEHPVTHVNAVQAAAFCSWIDKRLPTSAEWDLAAHGADFNPWPWGSDQLAPQRANMPPVSANSTTETTSLPSGQSAGTNVYHLAGNVWEWTASYESVFETYDPNDSWDGDINNLRLNAFFLQKGGSWQTGIEDIREFRSIAFNEAQGDVGFRCANTLGRTP